MCNISLQCALCSPDHGRPRSIQTCLVLPFANGRHQVTTKYLNGLIELIHSNLQTNEATSSLENPKRHFQRTLDYIASREYEGVVTAPK